MSWPALTLKLTVIAIGGWLGWKIASHDRRLDVLEDFIGDHAGHHLEQLP
jgi:hypothetical protein